MKHRNKKGKLLMIIGTVFILAALMLAGFNVFKERSSNLAVVKAQESVSAFIDKEPIQISTGRMDALTSNAIPMPVLAIDGAEYIGLLTFESLGLAVPVQSDWDYQKLEKAPCLYYGSAYSDNLVVAAHNYQMHFGQLNQLTLNDRVSFVDVDGDEFIYNVKEVEILKDTAVSEMTSGEWDLTLFTCTTSGEARVTIRCELAA